MFKKNLLFIVLFSISLFSCKGKEKISQYKMDNLSSFIYASQDFLDEILSSKNNSLVFIGSENCSSCILARPYLEQYIKITNQVIFWVDTHVFNNLKDKYSLYSYSSSTLLIIKEGKVNSIIPYSSNNYSSQQYINKLLSSKIKQDKYILNDIDEFIYSSTFSMCSLSFKTNAYLNDLIDEKILNSFYFSTSYSSFSNEDYIFFDKEKILPSQLSEYQLNQIEEDKILCQII